MNGWEYLIIGLPPFEAAKQLQGQSKAVEILNMHGAEGWEAVALTELADESVAVLLKRPTA
ncbi:MAG: hypothetical protein AB7L13_15365 [Acidimicrobiia bacterium]